MFSVVAVWFRALEQAVIDPSNQHIAPVLSVFHGANARRRRRGAAIWQVQIGYDGFVSKFVSRLLLPSMAVHALLRPLHF